MQALAPILVKILPYIQLILSAILVAVILLQQSDASLGGAFGGSDEGGSIGHTRRGAEKVLFNTTIIVGILFTASAFIALLIHV